MNSPLRSRSKSLFGNLYLLEVCSDIADIFPERICLMGLVGEKELSPSVYSSPLRRLVHGGFLRDAGRDPDDHRTHWYVPEPSPLWDAAKAIRRAIEEAE